MKSQRFHDLMDESGLTAQGCWDDMGEYEREAVMKFAELIIKDCIGICKRRINPRDPELAEIWKGALACTTEMKVHFGLIG